MSPKKANPLVANAEKIRTALRQLDQSTGLRLAWTAESQAEVAEFFGVSIDTVKNWAKGGMPGKRGEYRLDRVAQWLRSEGPWRRHEKTDDPLLISGDSPSLERYRQAKAAHAELDLAERRNELVRVELAKTYLASWAQELRRLGKTLFKRFGPEASQELTASLAECERILHEKFGERKNGRHKRNSNT